MFRAKVKAIPSNEQTETDLPASGVLLDHCFFDLDNLFDSKQRKISIINKGNHGDNDFLNTSIKFLMMKLKH
ncbi:hypothetical protein [Legionella parisiensis]|nr:hypothetical protein [Legionella parisiensis]